MNKIFHFDGYSIHGQVLYLLAINLGIPVPNEMIDKIIREFRSPRDSDVFYVNMRMRAHYITLARKALPPGYSIPYRTKWEDYYIMRKD